MKGSLIFFKILKDIILTQNWIQYSCCFTRMKGKMTK